MRAGGPVGLMFDISDLSPPPTKAALFSGDPSCFFWGGQVSLGGMLVGGGVGAEVHGSWSC